MCSCVEINPPPPPLNEISKEENEQVYFCTGKKQISLFFRILVSGKKTLKWGIEKKFPDVTAATAVCHKPSSASFEKASRRLSTTYTRSACWVLKLRLTWRAPGIQRKMAVVSWASVILVFFGLDLAQGLYFHMGETEKKCFIEEIPDETMVIG